MTSRQWRWRSVSAGLILFLGWGLVAAQQQPPPAAPPAGSPFKGGPLRAETPSSREVSQWSGVVREINEVAANNPTNLQNAKAALKAIINTNRALGTKVLEWYIKRLTWEELHEGRVPENELSSNRVAATMHDHMQELFGDRGVTSSRRILPHVMVPLPAPWVSQPPLPPPTPEIALTLELQNFFLEEVRAECLKHVKEVLENSNVIARLNAVRILDHFAAFGQDAVAGELLAVLENPHEHDAVKYYAILGLGRLFEAHRDPAKRTFKGDKGPETYRRCVLAVVAWLDKQTRHDPAKLSLLREEERQGISFVRRGAIQALADTHRPLVIDGAELGQAANRAGPIAEVLLRIVANKENDVQPPPTWTERVIAARAVCKLDPKLSPSYQPDFSAYVVAQLISELATAGRDADAATMSLYASELKGSVETLTATLPREGPGVDYVKSLVQVVHPVLEHINDRGKERTSPQALLRTLETNKPPAKEVYKPLQR